ncbi:alpha-1-antitrypsin homolog [Gouania willdenowi]|uniref:Alpha-1-antitrypsin homolog n=1 Tax=Gouania willdenowi TaxID=441366 RepID=A0A8C5I212_GOUWI|nr:alpha-1-antitrypsin homolog [Gouania willdenowi]
MRLLASCVAALLLALALADHHHHHEDHSHNGKDHEEPMSCIKLSTPNANFAFSLYKKLNADAAAGKNIFFSPLGISTALSMLAVGAHEETHKQMFSTLNYDAFNQTVVNEGYHHLLHVIGQNHQLDVGNAVALRTGFDPVEQFMNDVKNIYHAELFRVDFAKPEEAAAEINEFIAKKTHNKINDMIKDLDPEMAMVLINYISFRGEWENPFDGNITTKADFHVDENTKVQVDMMRRTGRYDHYHDHENHTTIIRMPYKGNSSMMIVLPDEGKMKEVEEHMTWDHMMHWHDALFRNNVKIYLPKFSISAEASLKKPLIEMGIVDAFDNKADFSGISEAIKLKVSKVSQKAMLSVDETGTEAAAATTIEIMPMSMPVDIKLDRPFLVFICETTTRNLLFMGKVNNPTPM